MDYQEMYSKYGEPQIRNVLKKYKRLFSSASLEYEDIKQEVLLMLWKKCNQLEKNPDILKDKQILEHYINRCIKLHLFNLLVDSDLFLEQKIEQEQPSDENLYMIPNSENLHSNVFFDLLKDVLTDQEYQVICNKFLKNETYLEIGKKINVTKQRAEQIYKKTLQKLKKLLDKSPDFGTIRV